MNRIVFLALLGVLMFVPLMAQAPAGWKLRPDNSTNASDTRREGRHHVRRERVWLSCDESTRSGFLAAAGRRHRFVRAEGHLHAARTEQSH